MTAVSLPDLRRHIVAAQGYATRRRRGTAADVEAVVGRLSCVQLDSIAAVARSHRLTLLSRVGLYPPGTVSSLLGHRPPVRVLGTRGLSAARSSCGR